MRVLLINGSPRAKGNTSIALAEVAKTLEAEGIETVTLSIGAQAVRGCVACGACTHACPQGLNIPEIMKDFVSELEKIPSWAAICKEREEAAKRNKK